MVVVCSFDLSEITQGFQPYDMCRIIAEIYNFTCEIINLNGNGIKHIKAMINYGIVRVFFARASNFSAFAFWPI